MTPGAPVPRAACQVCGDTLDGSTPETACPACDTPHHLDCWHFAEGCAVYGCAGSLALARQEAAGRVQEALREEAPPEGDPAAHVLEIHLPELRVPDAVWRALGRRCSGIPTPVWFATGLLLLAFFVGRLAFEARMGTVFLGEFVGMMISGLLVLTSPWLPRAFVDLEHLGETIEVDETTRKQLEARLGDAPDNVYLLEALALERMAEGDAEGAVELLQRVVGLQPANLQTRLHLGRAWLECGDRGRAMATFEEAEGLATTEAQKLRTRRWKRMSNWVEVRPPEA